MKKFADENEQELARAEQRMTRFQVMGVRALKGALLQLHHFLKELNLDPDQLEIAVGDEDILTELLMDNDIMMTLSGQLEKCAMYMATASESSNKMVEAHFDLVELEEEVRQLRSLPGREEELDYKSVQSSLRRKQ